MALTKEMMEGRNKRNHQHRNLEDELEETPTIGNWIDHDQVGASHALGEDVISAIEEVLGYE